MVWTDAYYILIECRDAASEHEGLLSWYAAFVLDKYDHLINDHFQN